MKKFAKEFKEFALQGNVMSLAIGLIIGAAFQEIVASLTENLLSPIIGLFMGRNFDTLEWNVLGVTLRYGAFFTSVINFFILAFVVFLLVRGMNKLFALKKEEEPVSTRKCSYCFSEIDEAATRCPACTSDLNIEVVEES